MWKLGILSAVPPLQITSAFRKSCRLFLLGLDPGIESPTRMEDLEHFDGS
jgi:hypothetical protein